jgi:outer membrane lipoprotein-sorting protein
MCVTEECKIIGAAFGRATNSAARTAPVPEGLRYIAVCFSCCRNTTRRLIRWRKACFAICLGLTLLSRGQGSHAADDTRAREIVDRVARQFISQSSVATVKMQVTKEDSQREISLQYWSLGESKILVRVHQPQRDAGTAILKIGSETWIYLPRANRTVKMSASMLETSWMGSNITLNDLVNQSRLTDDFIAATSFEGQRDGISVSEYTLTPKPEAAVVWGKIILEVRQADLMPLWQRYFDEDGKLVRELSFFDYQTVSGRLIPTRLIMRSMDHIGEQTTITYESIVFDVPIGEETFSLRNLKQ